MENIKKSNISELNIHEMQKINGGGLLGPSLGGLALALLYDIVSNHEAFAEGFKNGYENNVASF